MEPAERAVSLDLLAAQLMVNARSVIKIPALINFIGTSPTLKIAHHMLASTATRPGEPWAEF